MNTIFKESQNIKLDENFHLEPDGFKGLVLVFSENRKKTNKDKEEVDFVFTDKWYYPKLSQTLSMYLKLKTQEATDVEDLKNIVLRVEKTIIEIIEKY